jgi:hypothetical protein
MLRDIHRVFSSNSRQNANIANSLEESVSATQSYSGKLDNTNSLLQQTLSIQSVMLSEIKALNGGIRNLINATINNNNGIFGNFGRNAGNTGRNLAAAGGAAAVGAGVVNANRNNNEGSNSGGSNEGGTDLRGQNLTRGMRRNNPTNLIYVGQPGAMPPPAEAGEPQAVFASVEEGLSAGARQVLINYNRKGLKTARQIMDSRQGGWAEDRNAPQTMASGLGVGLDDDLDLNNPDKLEKFLRQLVKQEQGSNSSHVPDAAYRKAVNSALGGSRVATPQRAAPQQQQQREATPSAQTQEQPQQQNRSSEQPQLQRASFQPQRQASIDPNQMRSTRAPSEAPAMLPTTPGATMQRLGTENAIGYLHPDLRSKLQAAMDDAKKEGMNVSVFSAYRPPEYGVGGFQDKMRSLHSYGLAVDLAGVGKAGSPEAQKWYEIASRHGLYNPYGSNHPKEWNHYQLVPYKSVEPDNPLRNTINQSGPKNLQQMWDAAGQNATGQRTAEMQPTENKRAASINANAQAPQQYGPDPNDPSRSVPITPEQQITPVQTAAAYNQNTDGNIFDTSIYNPMAPRFSWPLQVLAEYGGRMLRA